jgi:hypothetical protein
LSAKQEFKKIGQAYDYQNPSSIYRSFPSWIVEEDEISGELKRLSQIIGSYFDELHFQIKEVPNLKDPTRYLGSDEKPYPFADRLLLDKGIKIEEIFSSAKEFERYFDRTDQQKFEKSIVDVKNNIYTNIYNNIVDIYKSKGTEKSIRNILRCFGVDEKLIKIKYYVDQEEFEIKENYQFSSVAKKFVDFNHVDRNSATIYQQKESGNTNSTSFISGSQTERLEQFIPATIEAEVYMPLKFDRTSNYYYSTLGSEISSSIFGLKNPTYDGSGDVLDVWDSSNSYDFRVFAVKDTKDMKDAKFILESDHFPTLETEYFDNVYDNTKWNIAVKVYPNDFINSGIVQGSSNNSGTIEFYGVSCILDSVINEFRVTASISSEDVKDFLCAPKRLYAGAYRTNWTGSILNRSDVKLGSLRYWTSHLEDDVLKMHNIDPENYGSYGSLTNTYVTSGSIDFKQLPDVNSLALNWDFSLVTGSDSSGQFFVYDISSGSLEDAGGGSFLNKINKYQHPGLAYGFLEDNTSVVDKLFIPSGKQKDIENFGSIDMINIRSEDDVKYDRNTKPVTHTIRFEKSMSSQISEEIINWLGSTRDFNNLIGKSYNRYTLKYNDLEYLKNIFFKKVNSEPDVERYLEIYKWLDSSLSRMIKDLIPASSISPGEIDNLIESHILERSKYWNKLPTFEYKESELSSPLLGVNYYKKRWSEIHHPIDNSQATNFEYWNKYSIPGSTNNSSSIDNERQILKQVVRQAYDKKDSELLDLEVIDNSVNFGVSDLYRKYPVEWARGLRNINAPFGNYRAVIFDNELTEQYSYTEGNEPYSKNKIRFTVTNDDDTERYNYSVLPFSIQSSSINTGYQYELSTNIDKIGLNNYHTDTYGVFVQQPMQGPFTNFAVGGNFHRTNAIATGTVDPTLRTEGWRFVAATNFAAIFSPWSETGAGFDMTTIPYVGYYRDMAAKSVVSTKNIKVASPGNYYHEYELMTGPENKHWIVKNPDTLTSITAEVVNLTGTIDYEVPEQNTTKKLFKQRFSAPGALNETSIGYLDPQTQQYGVYSTQTYRNIKTRSVVTNEMSEHFDVYGFTD